MSDKKKTKAHEPNIIFIGTQESKGETLKAEPPSSISTVGVTYKLPDAAAQHKGFYHENAAEIIRLMPGLYKRFTKKGA